MPKAKRISEGLRASRGAKAAESARGRKSAIRRGRPAKMVYINVRVRSTTRDALSALKRSTGAASQGAVIDALVAGARGS